MKKVLVAGSINIDLVASVSRFPLPGETLKGDGFQEFVGGKGANQASACTLQNVPVTLWGKIGCDAYGDRAEREISSLGIGFAASRASAHTGLAMIELTPEGQNRIVVIPGANDLFSIDDVQTHKHLIETHDIVVLQHEIPLDTCAYIASEAKKAGKIVILNPAPAVELPPGFLENVDYLIPNEHELAIISKMPAQGSQEIESAMLALRKKGVGCVITSLGERGLCYTDGAKVSSICSMKVPVVDTVGAGDSLIGAFAAYLAKGLPLDEALRHACASATISVTRHGAFGSAGNEAEVQRMILS